MDSREAQNLCCHRDPSSKYLYRNSDEPTETYHDILLMQPLLTNACTLSSHMAPCNKMVERGIAWQQLQDSSFSMISLGLISTGYLVSESNAVPSYQRTQACGLKF